MTTPVDFRVLGPVQAIRDGVEVDLRGDKPRAVLALLLLRRHRLVPPTVFAEEIWSRDLGEVQANLQVLVSQLRRALGPLEAPARGADQRHIRTVPGGYSIVVTDECYDLARFHRLRAEALQSRAAGDPAAAAGRYAAALAQWSGARALEDLAGLPFADAFAQTAEQELLGVLEARVAADLACGRHLEVLGELSDLTRRYPLNDVLCSHLLVALTRSGRAADAAESYHRFRARYQQELDAPVPEPLRRVWGAVARGVEVPDTYGPAAWTTAERTVVDEALSGLRAELVFGNGTRRGVSGRVTIGRIGCDVLVGDAKVSKSHAVISPTPDGFVLTDLQSTNGTFVNGEPVVLPRPLTHLDRIRCGDTEVVFRNVVE